MNARKIEGSVALVTGANRGIGRAITEALLERGAKRVYATARDPKTLEELTARHGGRVVPLRLDWVPFRSNISLRICSTSWTSAFSSE